MTGTFGSGRTCTRCGRLYPMGSGLCQCGNLYEMSEERDALNLARSRFDAAEQTYHLAQDRYEDAREVRQAAWEAFERAADDLAAANRRVLHTIASGGSHG